MKGCGGVKGEGTKGLWAGAHTESCAHTGSLAPSLLPCCEVLPSVPAWFLETLGHAGLGSSEAAGPAKALDSMALPEALGPSPPGTQPGLLLLSSPYGESQGDSDICSSMDAGQISEVLLRQREL